MYVGIVDLILEGNKVNKVANTPKEFVEIKERFMEAESKRTPILIERSALNLTQSIVIELEYVGDKWCMGRTTYHRNGGEIKVPYTISYADLYTTDPSVNTPKIIFKGDNPFG